MRREEPFEGRCSLLPLLRGLITVIRFAWGRVPNSLQGGLTFSACSLVLMEIFQSQSLFTHRISRSRLHDRGNFSFHSIGTVPKESYTFFKPNICWTICSPFRRFRSHCAEALTSVFARYSPRVVRSPFLLFQFLILRLLLGFSFALCVLHQSQNAGKCSLHEASRPFGSAAMRTRLRAPLPVQIVRCCPLREGLKKRMPQITARQSWDTFL